MAFIEDEKQSAEDVLRLCQLHGAIDLDVIDVDYHLLVEMITNGVIRPVVYELTAAGYEILHALNPPAPPVNED